MKIISKCPATPEIWSTGENSEELERALQTATDS